ncbi:oligosaccharide flippase family protein [[Eubacterium] hominis]|uniref:oligosaccharide flippase family protein n=1 Tax=[Eubacterium] hominis TaxID=2764325 RepID=UPI003A4D7717
MKNIGKKSVVLSFCNVTTLIITMLISMIIARYRSLEENGIYTLIMLIVNTVISFAILGIPNSITYFVGKYKKKEDKEHYIGMYYTAMFTICLTVGILLFITTPIIADFYKNQALKDFRYIFLFLPLFLQITSTISDILISFEKIKLLIFYRMIYSILLLMINVLMVIFKWDFSVYMFIYVCTLFFLTFIVYFIIKIKLKVKKIVYFNKTLLLEILKFSLPMGVATIVGTLSLEVDKLFIAAKFSTEVLGMYGYMAKELPIVAITSSVTSVLLPAIAGMMNNGSQKEAIDLWKKSTIITFSITMFFASGVFTYASQVIEILYSSKYIDGITIFRIYTFSLLLRFTYFGLFFNCTGNSKKVMYFSIIGLLLNICFNYIFYSIFGIIGPAIATVVSLYITSFLQLKGTAKLLTIKINELLPWRDFIYIFFLNVFLAFVFFLIQKYLDLDFVIGDCAEALFLGCVWGLIYWMIIRKKIIKLWKRLNTS